MIFCVNERIRQAGQAEPDIPPPLAVDAFKISSGGGILLEQSTSEPDSNNTNSPEQLLHASEHFDDAPRVLR